MRDRRSGLLSGHRDDSYREDDEWYGPFGPPPPPFYQRTGTLAAFAVIGVLALLGVGGYAWNRAAHPTPAAASGADQSQDAVVPPPMSTVPGVANPPSDLTTTAKPSTTTTTTTTITTTTTATDTTAAQVLTGTGRFTGTLNSSSGEIWSIGNWDGSAVQVRVTGSTQLTPHSDLIPQPQWRPGQTVDVFWHAENNIRVADSIIAMD
jgi:hypothetical protein